MTPDYLNVAELLYTWKEKIEAPAVLKRDKTYYMFGSHLSGWKANDNVYSTASSMRGPWSPWKNFAPMGSNTFNSQTTFILPVREDMAIYVGDRWVEKDLTRSTYVWLPLRISGNQASMTNQDFWNTPVGKNSGSISADRTYPAKSSASLSGGAKFLDNSAAGYIGGPSGGAVRFAGIQSESRQRTTIKILYSNGDKATRHAAVRVNGGGEQKIAFLSTAGGKGVSVFSAALTAGKNEIAITGWKGSWAPDIASLRVAP
jgi:hypothetical protein